MEWRICLHFITTEDALWMIQNALWPIHRLSYRHSTGGSLADTGVSQGGASGCDMGVRRSYLFYLFNLHGYASLFCFDAKYKAKQGNADMQIEELIYEAHSFSIYTKRNESTIRHLISCLILGSLV